MTHLLYNCKHLSNYIILSHSLLLSLTIHFTLLLSHVHIPSNHFLTFLPCPIQSNLISHHSSSSLRPNLNQLPSRLHDHILITISAIRHGCRLTIMMLCLCGVPKTLRVPRLLHTLLQLLNSGLSALPVMQMLIYLPLDLSPIWVITGSLGILKRASMAGFIWLLIILRGIRGMMPFVIIGLQGVTWLIRRLDLIGLRVRGVLGAQRWLLEVRVVSFVREFRSSGVCVVR